MTDKILAEFSEENIKLIVKTFDKTGKTIAVTSKTVTVDEFSNLFERNLKKDKKFQKLGKMPFGYIDGAINEREMKVILFIKGEKQTTFYEKDKFKIPFPNLLIFIHCKNGKINNTEIVCVKDNVICPSTQLFLYPFSNVSLQNRVCWGNCILPKIHQLQDFEKIPCFFIQSIMNNDYFYGKVKSSLSLRELLMFLETKNKFPKGLLKPTKETFKEWSERLLDK